MDQATLKTLCANEARRVGADPKTQAMLVRMANGEPEIRIVTREECAAALGIPVPTETLPLYIEVAVVGDVNPFLMRVSIRTPSGGTNRTSSGRSGNASGSDKRISSTMRRG